MAATKTERSPGTAMRNEQREGGALSSETMNDFMQQLRDYAKANPESAALWCFGIGFVLGWKLKPW